jgi:hypothetical protein
MALEQSYVFRQLAAPTRFGKYDIVDGAIVLESYTLHYVLELVLGGNELRPFATLVAAAVGVYVLRRYFPEGLVPLIRMMLTPRHLSAMVPERVLVSCPAAPQTRAGGAA